MIGSDSAPARYHTDSEPGLRHPFLTNWTVGDGIVAMISTTLLILALNVPGLSIVYKLLIAAPLLALIIRGQYGRLWWELRCMLVDAYIFLVLGDKLFVATDLDDSNSVVRFLRQKRYRRAKNRFVYPLRHTIVEAQGERYGIIQQLDRSYDHIPVRGHGSDFSSFDHNRQHDSSNALAYNVDQVAAQSSENGLRMGMSYVRLKRPANVAKTETYFALNGQPLVFATESFELSDDMVQTMARLRHNADQIIATQRANGASDSWQLAVATIKRTNEMDKAVKGQLDDPKLYDLPLIELGRQLVDAVAGTSMKVRDVHCLGYLELCQLIRGSYDVSDLSFYKNRYTDTIKVVTEADINTTDSPYLASDLGTLKDPFPVAPHRSIEVGNDYICMDGNWLSTIIITRRRETFHVSDVQKVYHNLIPRGTWASTVSAGQTISGSAATNVLVYQQRASAGVRRGLFGGRQEIEHPNTLKRRRALSQQTELLSASSLAQQFNDVITVVAPTQEKMIKDRAKLLGRFKIEGYKCRVIKGRSRQLDAAITGTLGIHRL